MANFDTGARIWTAAGDETAAHMRSLVVELAETLGPKAHALPLETIQSAEADGTYPGIQGAAAARVYFSLSGGDTFHAYQPITLFAGSVITAVHVVIYGASETGGSIGLYRNRAYKGTDSTPGEPELVQAVGGVNPWDYAGAKEHSVTLSHTVAEHYQYYMRYVPPGSGDAFIYGCYIEAQVLA